MTQAGPVDEEFDEDETSDSNLAGPLRRCIATGERKPIESLIRFVVGPDRFVVPDLAQTLPGRGVWVSCERNAIAKASKGLFAKALKMPAQAAVDLNDRIEALLVQRLVSLLGFSRRAGEIIMGFTKVEAAFSDPRVDIACLLIASGSGPSDRRKLLQFVARRDPRPHVTGILTSDEISLAFGRENVVHAALKRGGLAVRVWAEAERLSGFRPLIPEGWGTLESWRVSENLGPGV